MTPRAPLLMVCANQAWNLVNFRAGLIAGLRQHGFRVLALAPPEAEMEARLAALGCAFEPLAVDAMGLSPFRDLATFRAIRSAIARHGPAAWLSWTIKPNVYGSLAAGMAGVPALPNISGLGTAFIRRNLLTEIVKQLYRGSLRKAPAVLFQNHDDRDVFVENRLVRPEQVRILPGSGIDLAQWARLSDGRPARRHFLMLARVVADKGVREYVAAARRVRAKWPDARFQLMGPLDVANRTSIAETEVRGWEAEGIIEYLPPASDVRPAIAACDFVVLPSYREGLSRVLLEASALGRPLIAADVPGCRDIVSAGNNGFICAPRDAGSLADAMVKAAECDDATWVAMASNGRALVEREYSQERVTQIYLQALRDAGVAWSKPV